MGFRPFEPFKTFGESPLSEAGDTRSAIRNLILLGGSSLTPAQQWASALAPLSPIIDYRFTEASGNIVNNGSGTGANGTATALTYSQTGQLGAGEACSFNGSTSIVTLASLTPVAAVKTFTLALLVNLSNGTGRLWNTATPTSWLRFEATNTMSVRIGAATTGGTCQTSALTLNAWTLLFVTYDDTGDRKPRVYSSTGGAVVDISNTLVASVGTLADITGNMTVGAGAGVFTTGLYDAFGLFPAVLNATQMNTLVDAAF